MRKFGVGWVFDSYPLRKASNPGVHLNDETTIYRRTKREEWGFALLVEELQDRTAYVFQHAGIKTFTADYLHC